MNTQIIAGSINAIAQQNNKSIAETFLSCDVIIIVDTSGSMSTKDSRGGKSRYTVACEELAALQNNLPGKVAVIGFSGSAEFYPGGLPYFQGGGTDMAGALQFVKIADLPDMRFFLISDGEPDDAQKTLSIAGDFQNKIDTIYVGSESNPTGRDFLQRLAKITGGQAVTAEAAKQLKSNIERLLLK